MYVATGKNGSSFGLLSSWDPILETTSQPGVFLGGELCGRGDRKHRDCHKNRPHHGRLRANEIAPSSAMTNIRDVNIFSSQGSTKSRAS